MLLPPPPCLPPRPPPIGAHAPGGPLVSRLPTRGPLSLPNVRLHGRVVKSMGHLGHGEAMETGGREFDPRPGHYIVG